MVWIFIGDEEIRFAAQRVVDVAPREDTLPAERWTDTDAPRGEQSRRT
jgi:hypothetical protein